MKKNITRIPEHSSAIKKNNLFIVLMTFGVSISILLLSGCSLSTSSMMSNYFEKIKISIFQQEDPELVRQGVPTLILLLDAALAEDPDNPQLLLTAATTYSTYAQAFIISNKDQERAAILYGRAKEYAIKLLCQRSFFAKALDGPFEEYEKATMKFKKRDVPDLYAAGNAWIGWILSKPNSMEALSELPKALNLIQRVLDLDDEYADGGAHMIFGIYYAIQPPGAGRDLEKSRKHFQRALDLSGRNNLLPKVTYAEFYATAIRDEELYDKTLADVLDTSKTKNANRKYMLINSVAKERAKKLIINKGDFF